MLSLIKEELFCERQKPITMDDKSPAGYMLVDEYLSDDFASGCEDDKRLREGTAVNQTRRQKGQGPVSRKSRELFEPEKPFVKLRPAYSA